MPDRHYSLDRAQDYGFSVHGAGSTRKLPEWDLYRLRKITEVFETCEKVIDFGAATRGLSALLSEHITGEVVTVDIDPSIRPDVVADIGNLPFADSSFDGILCASILEHVYNPFQAVAEMAVCYNPAENSLGTCRGCFLTTPAGSSRTTTGFRSMASSISSKTLKTLSCVLCAAG